jgi:hypothetical protein
MNFPSSKQLKYAQNTLGRFPPDVIVNILIVAEDETFEQLCKSQEFASFCSRNSAFSDPEGLCLGIPRH